MSEFDGRQCHGRGDFDISWVSVQVEQGGVGTANGPEPWEMTR